MKINKSFLRLGNQTTETVKLTHSKESKPQAPSRQISGQNDTVAVKPSEEQPKDTPNETISEPSKKKTKDGPTKGELFTKALEQMMTTLGPKEGAAIFDAARSTSDSEELESKLISEIGKRTLAIVRSRRPGIKKSELRAAAKSDPELGELVRLLDSCTRYLREASAPAQASEAETLDDPFEKARERTQMFRETYEKIRAENQKHLLNIRRIHRETQDYIIAAHRESCLKVMKMTDEGHKLFLQALRGA